MATEVKRGEIPAQPPQLVEMYLGEGKELQVVHSPTFGI